MPWVLRGLREGIVTTRYPRRADDYGPEFRAGVSVLEAVQAPGGSDPAGLCPTGAIRAAGGLVSIDRGHCILCGRCVAAMPELFAFDARPETARVGRGALVVPVRDETDEELERLRADLAGRVRAFKRSLHIRHVDAGSDGSEEWEVAALLNPVYDVQRLGIYFTATPRHADLLLVTGAGSRGMAEPLRTTYEAMPEPKVVVAAGTDASSGGIVHPSYATLGGVASTVPVDVFVPGSPPSPFSLLHGILLAVGLLPAELVVIAALLLAALIVWAAGAVLDVVSGPRELAARLGPYLAGLCGSGLVAAAGVLCVLHPEGSYSLSATLGVGQSSLELDPLAGLFLTLTGGLGACISACLVSWARPDGRITGRGTGAGYLLLLGSVAVVLVAGDAFTFLFGWESLSVAFYILTSARRADRIGPRAAWATIGMGKVSGSALLLGFLLLASHSPSLSLAAFGHVGAGALKDTAYCLVVAGFAAKVGLMPFQVWLPIGYPSAQGPVRAAMAGLAANVGFYGLWRFLGILGRPPIALVIVVLVLGGVTALVGIAFAAVQSHLNRVIAYSSVENAGLILVGYGVALAGAATNDPDLVAVGLLAASLQVLAHAVAKCGLFASSAFFISDEGTDQLELLRGVGRQHPLSGVAFGLGSLTLAGLPPTIGFVSEWFLLEALLQEFRVHGLPLRLAMATAGALVALTAGVAALTFVRLLGFCILGRRAKEGAGPVLDGGALGRAGLGVLAAACLGLSAAMPWVVRYIAYGLAPVVGQSATLSALKEPWVLQPVFPVFSILSPSWLFVIMPSAFVAVGAMAIVLSRGRLLRVRRVPAWRSATPGVTGADQYSAYGYANSIRHVLANVLGHEHSTRLIEADTGEEAHEARREGHEPSSEAHVEVRSLIVEPAEEYLYRPIRRAFLRLVVVAKRFQSGRLDAYMAYMLVALLAVLVAVAALR